MNYTVQLYRDDFLCQWEIRWKIAGDKFESVEYFYSAKEYEEGYRKIMDLIDQRSNNV